MNNSTKQEVAIKNEQHISQNVKKIDNHKTLNRGDNTNVTLGDVREKNVDHLNGSEVQTSEASCTVNVNSQKPLIIPGNTPAKRKRGRPRKVVENKTECSKVVEPLSEANTSIGMVSNGITTKPSVVQRKRGRPKRALNVTFSDSESDDNVHGTKTHSISENGSKEESRPPGRSRKNNFEEALTSSAVKSQGNPRKKVKYISSDLDSDDALREPSNDSASKVSLSQQKKNKNLNGQILNGNAQCFEIAPTSESQNEVASEGSNTVPKKAKESGTMFAVKHIFKTLQENDVAEASDDPKLRLNNRNKGRNKVSNADLLMDEDGECFCMVCNETVVNENWAKHKRKIHYNLTWRKGDLPIDILDIQVMQKIFTQLRKDQGYLKCNKCTSQFGHVKKFIEHLEICNEIVSSTGLITCAVCKAQMLNTDWQYHRYKDHNNLAWRENETPLNLQDQDLVCRILTQLYKSKKPLHCEICKQQKKSVLGYLSHKSVCQLNGGDTDSIKVACKLCGRKVLPVSLSCHMKIHDRPSIYEETQHSNYFNVEEGNGKKRRAATDALHMIQSMKGESIDSSKYYVGQCDFQDNFVINRLKNISSPELCCIFSDCQFKTDSVSAMGGHLNSCVQKPEQYFVCKLCLYWSEDETLVKDHLQKVHNRIGDMDVEFGDHYEKSGSEADELMDEIDAEKKRLSHKAKVSLLQRTRVKPIFLMHPIREDRQALVYSQAYPWMLSFCNKYYSNLCLFDCLRNSESGQVLDCDILIKYLPRLQQSCDVTVKALTATQKIDITGKESFTKLDLFECRNFYEGEATLFCGGPVNSLAWLPTPFNEVNHTQILAVAVLNEADKDYVLGQLYNEPHIIQFWQFEDCDYQKDTNIDPVVLFGLAVTAGPIWHMEWCPSGCLDITTTNSHSRLGLLAVATSDSFVYIYCVDNVKNDEDRGLIYKQKPVLKLQLETEKASNNGQSYYATKTSWTKAKEHRYIAVGYSNGMIALYDLLSTSSLLHRQDQTGVRVLLPYQTFQGHVSCITALTLSHYDGGNRYCFSASVDKFFIYWDLSNNTKVSCYRKFGIADGQWLTQWPTSIIAEDETTFNDNWMAQTFTKPLRDVMSGEFWSRFTFSQSGIKSISFSDWFNLILHGGNAGEVMGQFAHRLFCNIDQKQFKKSYIKCIFSTSKLVEKSPSCNGTPDKATYDQASANYGIAFLDYNSGDLSKVPNSKTNDVKRVEVEKYNIEDYPLQAITKVALNPNLESRSIYATGHQAGFVRIRRMALLKSNFSAATFSEFNFAETL